MPSSDKLAEYIIVMACINAFLFLGNFAVADNAEAMNQTTPATQYDRNRSLVDYNPQNPGDTAAILPDGQTSQDVSGDEGNVFTDTFNAVKGWLSDSLGLSYLSAFITALPSFLSEIGAPQPLVYVIGGLWYSVVTFLIVSWTVGRG